MSDENKETPKVVSLRPVDEMTMDFIRAEDEESKQREAERQAAAAGILKESNVESLNEEIFTPGQIVSQVDWQKASKLLGIVFDNEDKPVILLSSMEPKDVAYAKLLIDSIVTTMLTGHE
jgi:hypothetical protein